MPVLPSAAVGALLCVLVVFVYERSGFAALSLLIVVLRHFQYLLRELLLSQDRAERLAALQIGVLTSMIETLALRDRMTARHSAAVARYARAMAIALDRPAGRAGARAHRRAAPRHRQVRVPGLDPARRSAADATSSGRSSAAIPPTARGSSAASRATGRSPTSSSATTSAGTAPATRAGSRARRSRSPARLIAVADAYDVLTARDSYRQPVSATDAVAELRACAGTQFDPQVVRDVRERARLRATSRSATATTPTSRPSSRSSSASAITHADGARSCLGANRPISGSDPGGQVSALG